MAFSKSEDSHRECREFANNANKLKKIREIRPFALHLHCTKRSAVQVFVFQIGQLVKRL